MPKDMLSDYHVVSCTTFRVHSGEHLEYYATKEARRAFWNKLPSEGEDNLCTLVILCIYRNNN